MAGMIKDRTNKKINKWTFLKRVDNRHWICRCECGNEKEVYVNSILKGISKSCGCNKKVHGMENTSEYNAWKNMKARCNNINHPSYKYYGGRGIKVCDRWNDFTAFYYDMGPKKDASLTLDRINNDGNYEPSNCRWATMEVQANNKRS